MSLIRTILAIGIAVIFTVFIAYGLYVFYEPPKYEPMGGDCYAKYDCWNKFIFSQCEKNKTTSCLPNGPCPIDNCYQRIQSDKEYLDCQKAEDECNSYNFLQTEKYRNARNSFFILIIIGLAAIISGVYLKHLESIGSGFIAGGVLVILWALPYTWEYWLNWNKYMKLGCLGIVLIVLVYLGYKKLEEKTKK